MLSSCHKSPTWMASLTLIALTSLATVVEASTYMVGPPVKMDAIVKRATTYSGCYSSSSGLKESATYMFQSSGWCSGNCLKGNSAVIGLTNGNDCWCGDSLPPSSSKVDDSKCSKPCDGFPQEKCGANGYFTVYTTGVKNVNNNGLSSSSDSSSSDSSSSSSHVVTSIAPGQTVVVTLSATPDGSKKSGPNTAGIAAGVVVGIVGVSALCGGLYFFLRRRKQRAAEEEFRRNNQMSEFMKGSSEIKQPESIYSGASDARLDPVAGRRDSSGSLADEQDYSRRILRVANPDR